LKKAAVGGGVVAATWAAPKVEGMKLVPNYAAASSQLPVVFTGSFQRNFLWELGDPDPPGNPATITAQNVTVTVGVSGGWFLDGGGTWSFSVGDYGFCTQCELTGYVEDEGVILDPEDQPDLPATLTKPDAGPSTGDMNTPAYPETEYPWFHWTITCT